MTLEIISPVGTLFKGEVSLIQLPGKSGSFEILNNHAPMISALKKGKIKVIDGERQTSFIDIEGGTLKVERNTILILAD
ncbi:MAG: ATP synthase F1 subunit epsilon [Lentimicrobium sp.]|jgi:F-type H+-transporting ATPase subunit epsilon|nr:ATP synthase F1 subunit epsilon [Lentimicrobium sp.]